MKSTRFLVQVLVFSLVLNAGFDLAIAQDLPKPAGQRSYEYGEDTYTAVAESEKPASSLETYDEYHATSRSREMTEQLYGASSIGGRSGYYPSFPRGQDRSTVFRPEYSDDGVYRQPVSIVAVDASNLFVATKRSGQVFRIDPEELSVELVFENPELSFGLMAKIDDRTFAVIEQRHGAVVIMQTGTTTTDNAGTVDNLFANTLAAPTAGHEGQAESRGDPLTVSAVLQVPGLPHHVAWDDSRSELLVSSQWAQRLYRWQRQPAEGAWSAPQFADLPMCGGQVLCLRKHGVVLVVDAFGRDYAVVDAADFRVCHQGKLYGHNVTALATNDDESMVFFPHQLLNEFARSVTTDITWGGLMSNNIRWLQTERLLNESGEAVFKQGKFVPLGTPGNGAGDPSAMDVNAQGRIAVALAGTNRVAISQEDGYFRQVDVGFRPVDLTFGPDQKQLFVVNQFTDNISVVDLDSMEAQHVALGLLRAPSKRELGEQLFFSSRLSHDGWMSCHSCHSEGHTNGQLNDNFSDHSFGTPKRVRTLLGQSQTLPYAWNGQIESLEKQVMHSVVSTMAGSELDAYHAEAIADFVRGLPVPPSLAEVRRSRNEEALLAHGASVFKKVGCAECHAGSQFTSAEVFDVGMQDEDAMKEFNPPSLLGISQRQNSLFHDGSANSIAEVVKDKQHQIDEAMPERDVDALVAYLQSL